MPVSAGAATRSDARAPAGSARRATGSTIGTLIPTARAAVDRADVRVEDPQPRSQTQSARLRHKRTTRTDGVGLGSNALVAVIHLDRAGADALPHLRDTGPKQTRSHQCGVDSERDQLQPFSADRPAISHRAANAAAGDSTRRPASPLSSRAGTTRRWNSSRWPSPRTSRWARARTPPAPEVSWAAVSPARATRLRPRGAASSCTWRRRRPKPSAWRVCCGKPPPPAGSEGIPEEISRRPSGSWTGRPLSWDAT